MGEFVNVAREAFHYLEPALSPHVVCDIPKLAVVCYCNKDTAVEIIHDRLRGGELYVALTRRLEGRDGVAIEQGSLGDIIAVDHDLASTGVRTFMVRPDDTALLRHCLGQLAQWTREYATPVLAGDMAWFRRRDERRDPCAPGKRIERAQRTARTAWSDGDYRSVITSYAKPSATTSCERCRASTTRACATRARSPTIRIVRPEGSVREVRASGARPW